MTIEAPLAGRVIDEGAFVPVSYESSTVGGYGPLGPLNLPRNVRGEGGLGPVGDVPVCGGLGGGGAGFGAGGSEACARNFERKPTRARSARNPRARRFFGRRFLLGFMKRESTRRTVGMNVGTSSGGSSNPLPSLSVVVVPSSASMARANRGKMRDSDRKREYGVCASAVALLPC